MALAMISQRSAGFNAPGGALGPTSRPLPAVRAEDSPQIIPPLYRMDRHAASRPTAQIMDRGLPPIKYKKTSTRMVCAMPLLAPCPKSEQGTPPKEPSIFSPPARVELSRTPPALILRRFSPPAHEYAGLAETPPSGLAREMCTHLVTWSAAG
ncbi:hypothetical protein BC628DRAFT_1398181 [Trametes gibbosa]|nr:hypothetical protein BC628DRAFT_1398181 [Trametes gibbosa]